jgi:molybdate transport system regulatory protein
MRCSRAEAAAPLYGYNPANAIVNALTMARYPGLMLRILGQDYPALGPGKAALIAHIEQTGSISAAARAMGMSYRRAWQLVDALNENFTELVVTTEIGGRRGGGAAVTAFGKQLVAHYRAMEEKASAAIADDLKAFTRHLRKPPARRKSS